MADWVWQRVPVLVGRPGFPLGLLPRRFLSPGLYSSYIPAYELRVCPDPCPATGVWFEVRRLPRGRLAPVPLAPGAPVVPVPADVLVGLLAGRVAPPPGVDVYRGRGRLVLRRGSTVLRVFSSAPTYEPAFQPPPPWEAGAVVVPAAPPAWNLPGFRVDVEVEGGAGGLAALARRLLQLPPAPAGEEGARPKWAVSGLTLPLARPVEAPVYVCGQGSSTTLTVGWSRELPGAVLRPCWQQPVRILARSRPLPGGWVEVYAGRAPRPQAPPVPVHVLAAYLETRDPRSAAATADEALERLLTRGLDVSWKGVSVRVEASQGGFPAIHILPWSPGALTAPILFPRLLTQHTRYTVDVGNPDTLRGAVEAARLYWKTRSPHRPLAEPVPA